jgi:hypothetical protein
MGCAVNNRVVVSESNVNTVLLEEFLEVIPVAHLSL